MSCVATFFVSCLAFLSSATMDCTFCNRTMEGSACIRCSHCSSHYHLECVSSEQLPTSNTWRCCRCENVLTAGEVVDTAIRA